MNDLTFTNIVTCADLPVPTTILPTECIGNSLAKINNNFTVLYNNALDICDSLSATISSVEQNVVLPPIKSIVMWSGPIVDATNTIVYTPTTLTAGVSAYIRATTGQVNQHWAVCTGATINGIATPNLIGRFVVGAGTKSTGASFNDTTKAVYNINEVGGEEKHQITINEMPGHNHGAVGGTFRVVSSVSFTPPVISYRRATPSTTDVSGWVVGTTSDATTTANQVGNGLSVSRTTISITISSQGGDVAHENRPPYYSLYYIMRVA